MFYSNYSNGAFAAAAIQRVSSAGGAPVDVVHRNKGLPLFPTFLADGRHFLYVAVESDEQNGAYVGSLDGKENRRVLPDVSNAVFADGRLLFIRENTYGPVF